MDLTVIDTQDLSSVQDSAIALKLFVQLPPEIRSIISTYFQPSLTSSLFTAKKTLLLDSAQCLRRTVVERNNIVNSLWVRERSVFNEQYISSIAFNKTEGMPVRTTEFKGLKFTIGRYGLRALSILYTDGSASAWLGSPTNGWTGIMYGNDISELHVLHDVSFVCSASSIVNERQNLKYIRIGLEEKEVALEVASRVMWDKLLHFTSAHHHYIIDTVATCSQVRNFPGWRLCEYLPLIDSTGGISCLTMYCNGHGVTGMVAHGQAQRRIGLCQGCPIHFYMEPKERIVSIWLRIPAHHVMVENEPSILASIT
ncbi:hypothetical protein B0O99DRAFT_401865 [Bisporella sp. PMI_857]|nr:hypothetical protein B0O99DRAFT_401865 [Bisporella sp. PMI_857]